MRDPVVAPAANRTLTCQFNLTDKNVTDLGLHKQDLSKYRVVDLSQNKFTHEALHYILPCCARIPGLEILKLHKNRIGDLGAEQLADFCKRSTTLRELHLSHNCFTAHGAVIIVHAAERSRSLCRSPLWLRLERNAVEHPAEVADALQQTLSVCFRVDRTACNSARCYKNCKVHLPYFLRQNTLQTDSCGGSPALREVDDSMSAPGSPSKKPVHDLEDGMGAAGPSDAHIENLECLPEPKLQSLGAGRMLKRRLSNRHVPGLQQESSTDKLANWCQTAWDAGNPCKRSNTKTNDEQARPKMPSKPFFASTAAGDPLKSPALGAETAVELPPFPPLPLIPKPQQTPDSAMPGRCMLKPRRGDQAQSGAEGLQESVVMAKVDELSAWHEELKAREKYLHLCEDTVRELLLSEVQPNTLDVDDREKSAMRQLEAWANGQDGLMASAR